MLVYVPCWHAVARSNTLSYLFKKDALPESLVSNCISHIVEGM